MGLGDNVMEQLERFLLMASQENGLLNLDSIEASSGAWSTARLVNLGEAIHTMLQGYFDKAINVTSGILSWVTHFTLQVYFHTSPAKVIPLATKRIELKYMRKMFHVCVDNRQAFSNTMTCIYVHMCIRSQCCFASI